MAYLGKAPVNGFHSKQTLSTDGSTTTFTLDFAVADETSIIVSVGGVLQEPKVAYNLATAGTQITFTAAPAATDTAYIVFLGTAIVQNLLDLSGAALILDADDDTTIRFPADNTISFETGGTQAVKIDSNQRLVIATGGTGNASVYADDIFISGSGPRGITIHTTSTSGSRPGCLFFGEGTSVSDMASGVILFEHSGNYMHFSAGGSVNVGKSIRLNGDGTVRFDSTPTAVNSMSLVIKSHKARAVNDNNGIVFRDANDHTQAVINVQKKSTSDATSDLVFRTSSGQVVNTLQGIPERMRIKSDGHVLPAITNTQDLGSSSKRWRNVYTTDLQLSNEGKTNDVDNTWGDYTIQEGESDLFLINNRNGKKYKFNLTEVS